MAAFLCIKIGTWQLQRPFIPHVRRNLCQKPTFENRKNSKGYSLAFLKSRKF
ncbi:hypothetical protein T09_12752 [Trichinella sp. T9]|nr:hypothetical protein T09_12752 [Trichinella sp. T9]